MDVHPRRRLPVIVIPIAVAVLVVVLAISGGSDDTGSGATTSVASTSSTSRPAPSTTAGGPPTGGPTTTIATATTLTSAPPPSTTLPDDPGDAHAALIDGCNGGDEMACYEVGRLQLPAPRSVSTGNEWSQAPDDAVTAGCLDDRDPSACYEAGYRNLAVGD